MSDRPDWSEPDGAGPSIPPPQYAPPGWAPQQPPGYPASPTGYQSPPAPGYPPPGQGDYGQRSPSQGQPAPPAPPWQQPPANAGMPSAYWPLSIVATVLSLVFGIVAIVFSSQVQQKWRAGDVAGAKKSSDNAKLWGIIGCVVGGVFIVAALGNA